MSSLFGQPAGGSLFGQSNTQQTQNTSSIFGGANANQSKPSLFGSLNTNTATSQPQTQTGGSLFAPASQTAQTGGLFGSSQAQQGSVFNQSQPQQSGGLFNQGATTNQQPQPQQSGGLFNLGATTNQQPQPQQSGGLFNLGATTAQQPQQQQQGNSLFGGFGQTTQQPQQNQQQGSVLGQPLGQSRIVQPSDLAPRQKSVIEQIELAFAKWNPASPQTLFQTYLYNSVQPELATFYSPPGDEDETKWEEALAKRPTPGSIPVLVRGFEQIAARMQNQHQRLEILHGRLYEINSGLNNILQKHDLEISIRAAECRRRHLRLSRQCLTLAAKTQVLRNRGYAMDGAEEQLRKKLLAHEATVFDPALNGRAEEIWARMVSVRERGKQLQREFERAGKTVGEGGSGAVIDDEVMKRANKILEDYDSQISHLVKELERIRTDMGAWEQSRGLGK